MAIQIARVHSARTSGRRPTALTGVTGVTGPDEDLNIGHIDVVHGVPVVRLTGELDLLSRGALERLLRPVVASHANTVVVDTGAVTFIDCAGLHPLVEAAVRLRRRRAFLLMLRPSAAVMRLATLTGTCELLDLQARDVSVHPR